MIINAPAGGGTRSTDQDVRSRANMVGFFDYTRTFSNESSTVICCGLDDSAVTASCGLGQGCEAACFALDRTLCPSGDCHDCYQLTADSSGARTASSNSAEYNHCVPGGCKVDEKKGGDPACCYVKECFDKRPEKCCWMNNYLGKLEHQ